MKINLFIEKFFFTMILIWGVCSCKTYPPTDLARNSIIPKPVSVVATKGTFELSKNVTLFVNGKSDELMKLGEYFAGLVDSVAGFNVKVKISSRAPFGNNIFLSLVDSLSGNDLGEEGYKLNIDKNWIKLAAFRPAGIFRGLQTLRQLFPVNIDKDECQKNPLLLATGIIRDFPQYSYRGIMLDVARHFFEVEDVKKCIDYMSFYKMNFLHLHLSDDQGWRIEIKSWPNLTIHGGKTEVGGGKGGFYTQEEYKDIVKYAQDRYVTIVPEIDMPGHTNAALSSYPELNCNGKATKMYTGTHVGFSTLCPKKEIVFDFIDDVVREISAITPGSYFHIGGDEARSTSHKDYIYFINKIQKIVTSYNKRVIGWDEISSADLLENAIIQYWGHKENAFKGLKQGAKVIISPARLAYLDMKYDSTTVLGLSWAGYIEVDNGYNWEMDSLVPGINKKNILGIEAPLWSETVTNMKEIEYMMIPRMLGYAEIGWTQPSQRNWEDYKVRLGDQAARFKLMGINYYPSKLVPWNNKY